ncbi:MAG: hypothetical protein GY884_35845 [Proteobacteria bacterium]|nr:hypothetical protein [Pseudomonadota bacterium]
MPTSSWLLLACVGSALDTSTESREADRDGDGPVASEHCDDDDRTASPSQQETGN